MLHVKKTQTPEVEEAVPERSWRSRRNQPEDNDEEEENSTNHVNNHKNNDDEVLQNSNLISSKIN